MINNTTYVSLGLLIKLTLVCGLSSFYYGYCTTYFNSINFDDVIVIFRLEDYPRALTQGLLTGSTCFTGALGTLLSVGLISNYSRRESLMILSLASFVITIFSLIPSIVTLVFVRLVQGLLIGCISCITPLYMREMIPKEISGPMWSLHQVCYVIGVTFGFILSYFLSFLMDPLDSWTIIFGFPLVTSVLQLILFQFVYKFDTPKWYVINNRMNEAKSTIRIIYKHEYAAAVFREIV